MKTLNIIPLMLALLALLASLVASANDKFNEAMEKNIKLVYAAKSVDEFQAAINAFQRIGEAEKNKWEPYYYAAYGYLMLATIEKDGQKKDGWIDYAIKAVDKGKTIQPGESELIALEGFAYMMRVTVDPASRGPQFSGMAFQSFGKALALNPNNPRALALMAQMQFGTAQFFGSSTAEACGTVNKSLEQFEVYRSDNPLAPTWGKAMAEGLKKMCQ